MPWMQVTYGQHDQHTPEREDAMIGMPAGLTTEQEDSVRHLTDAQSYGGAVQWEAKPCVVVYGTPCWIMPNGYVRVGSPDAPMIDREHAARTIGALVREGAA
jgi:hypothetical protein